MSSVDDENHPAVEIDLPDEYESASDCEQAHECNYLGDILKAKKSLKKIRESVSPGVYPGSAGAISSLSERHVDENKAPVSAEVFDSLCGRKTVNSIDLRFRGLRGLYFSKSEIIHI